MHTYVHRVGVNGLVWTVINSRGRILINTESLERAVDYSLWRAVAHKRSNTYAWHYMPDRWYAVQPVQY